MSDLYKTLGISRNSNSDDIKKAYRALARKYHPDLNSGDANAEEKFKTITEAYEVLADENSRKKYDRFGENWKQWDQAQKGSTSGNPFPGNPVGGFGNGPGRNNSFRMEDLGDLLGGFAGEPRFRGSHQNTVHTKFDITLKQAYLGTSKNITFKDGSRQRRIEVSVPPGVDNGSIVTVRPGGGVEIKIDVEVKSENIFQRIGNDLYTDVMVPFTDAVLGGEIQVPTMSTTVALKIPECSQNGQKFRLSGKGMPHLKHPERFGDLFAVLRPMIPEHITEEERKVFTNMRLIYK
jgi:curved DNA-binding protein|tara:strand:- start:321 stop:1196 length:876 start_codon:yes stop_codon:yes gene_type:complete